MADFKPFLDDFGFLPHEKGLEPTRQNMDSVVTPKIISHLKNKLDSRKKSEKLAAAWEVAHLRDKRLWPILKKNLHEETDTDILNELLSAFIINPHSDAANELSRFIFVEKRFSLRKKAIWVLSHFEKSREAKDALKNLALTDPDPRIRKQAVFALGEVNDQTSSQVLKEILVTDEDARVRQMTIWALGRTRSDYEAILKSLEEDSSTQVRREAAWILGRNQVEEALDELLVILKRENDEKVLEVILWSIAKIDASSLSKADVVLEEDFDNRI
ncbi:MAG: HEAT repeat domain-containing protein, partial [Patescibacteria group bacterium]|nr:HEAT repeat domain-containing protein [Patescibacteria group bacterium]